MIRILEVSGPRELGRIMQDIKVDNYGIKIMVPKGITHLVRLSSLSCIAANILKQEMLSLGGDVAVARDTLTGRIKKTDCLLMGSLSQFNRLNQKLDKQPFGLNRLSAELSVLLTNYQRNNFSIDLGRYKLNLNRHACIMGILNLTPDSFSGDGLYRPQCSLNRIMLLSNILRRAEQMVKDGADVLDLGGESTRPGARAVSLKDELERTIPVIKLLSKKINVPISIDTRKPEVARQALDNGVSIVNDITGLKSREMLRVAAKYKAAVVVMHMQGGPRTMQKNPSYDSLIDEIIEYLNKAICRALDAGIDKGKIIVDPGIGFGKTLEHNLEILNRLKEFKALGKPILVGPSRKSFIGKILNVDPGMRISGTISSCVLALKNGANLVRVHDVLEVKQALMVGEAIINS
jgi:dihydropteroate synthase